MISMKKLLALLLCLMLCLLSAPFTLAENHAPVLGEPPVAKYSAPRTAAKSGNFVRHDLTREEIVAMEKKLASNVFNGKPTRFATNPRRTAPYAAGSVNQADLNDALNTIKMLRFLAGVPYEHIVLTPEYNNIAQHGAVLLDATHQFTHYPTKPADMDDAFFALGYEGCASSNIHSGVSDINLALAVLRFVFDDGANNIAHVGHRAGVFAYGQQAFGLGYAVRVINMYLGDMWSVNDRFEDYIAWPNSGDVPLQYVRWGGFTWSITLGGMYNFASKNQTRITLKRLRDNKIWKFDSTTPDLSKGDYYNHSLNHFAVNNNQITFRPAPASLGELKHDDQFEITVEGITYTNGSPAEIKYTTTFFDLYKGVVHATGVSLNKANLALCPGEQQLLTASVKPANASTKTIRWSSSNESVVTVNESGNVTAIGNGKATITATTVDGGFVASCAISVQPRVTELTSPQATIRLRKGQSAALPTLAKTEDERAATLVWETSNKKIVTVSASGKIKGIKKGNATITASAPGGKTLKFKVQVASGSKIKSIGFKYLPPQKTLTIGESFAMGAKFAPAKAQGTMIFSSNNPSVISIDAMGAITALKPGRATITVKMDGRKKSTVITAVE